MAKIVSNKRQLNRLVELMEANNDIAKGFCSKTTAHAKWEQFAIELNSLGPPEREWHKWQRVWTDLKCKVKKKKVENKKEISATGGGPNILHQLNDMEETVVQILEINTLVDPPRKEFGLTEENTALPVSIEKIFLDDVGRKAKNNPSPKKAKVTPRIEEPQAVRIKLLEDQTSFQKEFYGNMTNLLSDIKRSAKNIEDYTKKKFEQDREYYTEILKLKREKLKIYKENKENKDIYRKAKCIKKYRNN